MKDNTSKKDDSAISGFGSGFGSSFGNQQQPQDSSSQFGNSFGSTNAVSQIFKDASLASEDRKKRFKILGAVTIVALVGVGALLLSTPSTDEFEIGAPMQPLDQAPPLESASKEQAPSLESLPIDSPSATLPQAPDMTAETNTPEIPTEASTPSVADSLSVPEIAPQTAPSASGTHKYDERSGGPVIRVKAGEVVEVSRNASFTSLWMTGSSPSGELQIPNPPAGTLFWRVQGETEIQSLEILPPDPLNIQLTTASSLSNGGQISWSSDDGAAFYRVEFASDAQFSDIVTTLSSQGKSVTLQDIPSGSFHVRVKGFSQKSGRWEASRSKNIQIQ